MRTTNELQLSVLTRNTRDSRTDETGSREHRVCLIKKLIDNEWAKRAIWPTRESSANGHLREYSITGPAVCSVPDSV